MSKIEDAIAILESIQQRFDIEDPCYWVNGEIRSAIAILRSVQSTSISDSSESTTTPLHRHADSTRQTIAELIEAKADASAIALLANHLESVELLIQRQGNVGVMRAETDEEKGIRH